MRKLLIILGSFLATALLLSLLLTKSDDYIRHRLVKLVSEHGSCSGEQIRAPSGKDYVLTAGHCSPLIEGGMVKAIDEDGKAHFLSVIKEDEYSDLLLLSGIPGLKGLDIAEITYAHEDVRTFTHGGGMDSYKTEGEIIQEQMLDIPLKAIQSAEECQMPKQRALEVFPGLFLCLLHTPQTMFTAWVIPGSSGGPIVDSSGDLVGVVSATDGKISTMVRLTDIHNFIKLN